MSKTSPSLSPPEPAPGAALTHLLYLHGFRSSPASAKARQVAAWVAANRPDLVWHCPPLPPSPRDALDGVLDDTAAWPRGRTGVIGSSLGGFYATAFAERTGARAVMLNPAIDPARDLAAYIGELKSWHGEDRFFFRAEFIDELREIAPPSRLTNLERYFAVIAKGDELLSWREMSGRYAGCRQRLIEGSDHALTDFATWLPEVTGFLGL